MHRIKLDDLCVLRDDALRCAPLTIDWARATLILDIHIHIWQAHTCKLACLIDEEWLRRMTQAWLTQRIITINGLHGLGSGSICGIDQFVWSNARALQSKQKMTLKYGWVIVVQGRPKGLLWSRDLLKFHPCTPSLLARLSGYDHTTGRQYNFSDTSVHLFSNTSPSKARSWSKLSVSDFYCWEESDRHYH